MNAVVVGSGRRRRRRLLRARGGRPQRRRPREGPVALPLRGAQGRPRQPAEREPRRSPTAPTRTRTRACSWTPRASERDRLPEGRRLPGERELRRGRHRELRRPGLALHAPGLPHALDLRHDRGLDARGLADLLRRPGALLREGRIRDRGERRRRAEPLQGSAAEAAPHAASLAEAPRARDPETGRPPAGSPSLRHPAPHQQRAARRPLGLHAHPLVRGLRLRDERQERDARTP